MDDTKQLVALYSNLSGLCPSLVHGCCSLPWHTHSCFSPACGGAKSCSDDDDDSPNSQKKGSQNRATDTLDTLCSQSLPHREGRRFGTIHPGRDVGRLSVKDHLRSVSPSMCTTLCPSPSTSCKRATADDQTAALQDPGAPTTITNTGWALQLNQQGFMMRKRRLLHKRKFPPQTPPPTAYYAGKYYFECENNGKRTSCRSKP